MNFASDNAVGVAPEILAAIAAANAGSALAYGNDVVTRRVEQRFAELFEHEVAVFLVPTGTAANALAIAHLAPPWGAVLCHSEAHIATDECGAPEFFGGGIKLIGLPGEACKIVPATLKTLLAEGQWGGPHHVSPAVLSLSQATEAGTIYRPAEVRALAEVAHARGLAVHMDGARLVNALARLAVSPAHQHRGHGSALVIDSLRWMARWRVHQGWRASGGSRFVLRASARGRHAGAAQARGSSRLQTSLRGGADGSLSGR